MWFLIFSETFNSHDLVHSDSVLRIDPTNIGDAVRYFYRNKPYVGKIVEMSESYDELNSKLKALGAEARHVISKCKTPVAASEVLQSRRTRRPTERFVADGPSPSKKPSALEDEAKKIKANKSKAMQRTNADVAKLLKDSEEDADNASKHEGDLSADSDMDEATSAQQLCMVKVKNSSTRVSGIKPHSPTKEALKRKIFELQQKLNLAHDKSDGEAGSKVTDNEESAVSIGKFGSAGGRVTDNEQSVVCRIGNVGSALQVNNSAHSEASDHEGTGIGAACQEEVEDDDSKNNSLELQSSSCDNDDYTHQLRGDGVGMVDLHKGIYCRQKDLENALRHATNVNQSVKRLILGVFKPSGLRNVTLSGKPYRAGSINEDDDVQALHPRAMQTIVDYSNELAKKKGWKIVKLSKLSHTISVKLNEIKASFKQGKIVD